MQPKEFVEIEDAIKERLKRKLRLASSRESGSSSPSSPCSPYAKYFSENISVESPCLGENGDPFKVPTDVNVNSIYLIIRAFDCFSCRSTSLL